MACFRIFRRYFAALLDPFALCGRNEIHGHQHSDHDEQ